MSWMMMSGWLVGTAQATECSPANVDDCERLFDQKMQEVMDRVGTFDPPVTKIEDFPPDMQEAFSYMYTGCDGKVQSACLFLVRMYYSRNNDPSSGLAIPPDHQTGVEFVTSLCEDSDPFYCFVLATYYVEERLGNVDKAKSQYWANKAFPGLDAKCTSGDADTCYLIGDELFTGTVYPIDVPKAMTYFDKACTLGYGMACFKNGRLYDEGTDVPKDDAKSKQYFEKACALKYTDGCMVLEQLKK